MSNNFEYAKFLRKQAYIKGEGSRAYIDWLFLKRMLRVSKTRRDWLVAHFLYYKARVFGWISWKLAK